ncbi:hypothetical protein [Mesobacillus zeae]|uniref:hypothetical protein n=1 Tax=Mesobacillus zeae TaxID=1917180 RepID=UPI0030080BF4
MNEVVIFKFMPFIIYSISLLLSAIAGLLVYLGLSNKVERLQTRIRLKHSMIKSRKKLLEEAQHTKAEEWLKLAHYPLGLNGLRYNLLVGGFIVFLAINYVLFPTMADGASKATFFSIFIIGTVAALALPSNPFSLFIYFMKKVIDYQNAKKNAEVFMLYDLLINEIEMMTVSRINTYNVLRNLKPYFVALDKPMTMLLTSWSNDEGPKIALEKFAETLNSKESRALIGVIENLDELDRETALSHLRGMHSMFVRSQIENYRRKRKITTDLLSLPIKTTHFVIILNFLIVIVTMVSVILKSSRM